MIHCLTLDLPTSTNKLYAHSYRGVRLSDEARVWKQYATIDARNQWQGEPLEGAIRVTIHFHGLRLDIDNTLKVTLDSLIGVCFIDDKQVTELHCYIVSRKAYNRRMEIELEVIE